MAVGTKMRVFAFLSLGQTWARGHPRRGPTLRARPKLTRSSWAWIFWIENNIGYNILENDKNSYNCWRELKNTNFSKSIRSVVFRHSRPQTRVRVNLHKLPKNLQKVPKSLYKFAYRDPIYTSFFAEYSRRTSSQSEPHQKTTLLMDPPKPHARRTSKYPLGGAR